MWRLSFLFFEKESLQICNVPKGAMHWMLSPNDSSLQIAQATPLPVAQALAPLHQGETTA
jgi:hypothetical protein